MVKDLFTEEEIRRVSALLSALGNPTRFKIVMLVSETRRPLHIKAIAEMLEGDYAAIYRHVKVLEGSGLIGIYEVGRSRVLYPKDEDTIRLILEFVEKVIRK